MAGKELGVYLHLSVLSHALESTDLTPENGPKGREITSSVTLFQFVGFRSIVLVNDQKSVFGWTCGPLLHFKASMISGSEKSLSKRVKVFLRSVLFVRSFPSVCSQFLLVSNF